MSIINDKLKVSVIIAAYNASKYIEETLESISNQTMDRSDYEIIVVNDGSTDDTLDILHKYQSIYNNIRVVDKENGGPGSARNAGLDVAQGKTVFFFDSDDILESTALQDLFDRMEEQEADLVIAKFDIFDEKKTIAFNGLNELVSMDYIDKYDPLILETFSLSNKLFRRDIIEEKHIRAPLLSYAEDGAFLFTYLYSCETVTGLDETIFHYRKYNAINAESLTSVMTEKKIQDYLEAHRLIYEEAKKGLERDLSLDDPAEEESKKRIYLNMIRKREMRILISNCYPQFWRLDQKTLDLIVKGINDCIRELNMASFALISSNYPLFPMMNLDTDRKLALEKAAFTILLYASPDDPEGFIDTLFTLVDQRNIYIRILVPESVRQIVYDAKLYQENIIFVSCRDEDDFIRQGVEAAETDFICITDAGFTYTQNAFTYAERTLRKKYIDFLVEAVYHTDYSDMQPTIYSRIVGDSFLNGTEYNESLDLDLVFANKFLRTDFLKRQIRRAGWDRKEIIHSIYKKGHYKFHYGQYVNYEKGEAGFKEYLGADRVDQLMDDYMDDSLTSLWDEKVLINHGKATNKILPINKEEPVEALIARYIRKYKNKWPKDQVAFISIRSNGQLEGNALALYNSLTGCKKVVCAKKNPHDKRTMIRMIKLILTSRIIITDDYIRYIRYIPLRPQQRFIQLWHACGAFKKFGRRGTSLSKTADAATHAQYNLVCVSGKAVRSIYADAFGIEVSKVQALGVPRTDMYFDEERKKEIADRILLAHPEFRDKHVLLYAPTFRDIGTDRTQFKPELDFSFLSDNLREDQIMIICPHPVMENEIIDQEYPNIFVQRDFSTNEYMLISDLLITDYSSTIFEYALLRKPIVFFCYDHVTYNRGFYLNYPDDLPGPVLYTQLELVEYLKNLSDYCPDEKLTAFIDRYMTSCDGKSSERICSLIRDYMSVPYIMLTDKYAACKKKLNKNRTSFTDKVLGRLIDRMEKKYDH